MGINKFLFVLDGLFVDYLKTSVCNWHFRWFGWLGRTAIAPWKITLNDLNCRDESRRTSDHVAGEFQMTFLAPSAR
jgi:hypothetical protein